ncbi:putative ATP-dependent RNA helicase [Trypoxylus dichotomus]
MDYKWIFFFCTCLSLQCNFLIKNLNFLLVGILTTYKILGELPFYHIDTDSEQEFSEEENISIEKKSIKPPALNENEEAKKISRFELQKINVKRLMEDINTPTYSDVTPMVNSKIPFLIDGDALIMYAFLQENHETMLGDLGYHLSLEEFNKRMSLSPKLAVDVHSALILTCTEIVFFRANDLPCIDLCEINIDESLISSFHLDARRNLIILSKMCCQMLVETVSRVKPSIDEFVVNCDYSEFDARRAVVIIASSKFLSTDADVNFLKLILLSYASLEVLQLEHRCCPIFKFENDSLANVQDKIMNWMDCILYALQYCLKYQISLLWNNIADIWQATMFSYICHTIQDEISSGAELGHLKEAYEQYIHLVKRESSQTMDAYPILPYYPAKNGILLRKEEINETEKVDLHMVNNTFIRKYCGETFQNIKWQNQVCFSNTEEFDEIRHWHCNKPLTDDYDRVKDNFYWDKSLKTEEDFRYNEIKKQKQIARHAHYLYIYGCNLEGAEMTRIADGVYDADIGFTPDPWQAKFINAIRKNKSALVVAPTSSGKTFAAYYCMKRVLKESEDGIVVYVAPTKALVNQVEATVYSRFKDTKLRAGKAIVGVFTRDYRNNTLNSRILITVPQCLEILLLSPRRYTWLKNLKYAIFDEVHKLSGSEEGLVWERCLLLIRCPFLALSATISDVPNFYNWLVSNENFKREQDLLYGKTRNSYDVILVEHTERHTDLKKYVYDVPTGLQHYHPYCALNSKVLTEHDGIPITLHLSPEEVLQLFDVMHSNEALRFAEEDNIYNFFSRTCENGFINRNDVSKNLIEYTQYLMIEECENEVIANERRNQIRDEVDARRKQKAENKKLKIEKKKREKKEGNNEGEAKSQTIESSVILKNTGSKFKGVGIADSQDVIWLERRLLRFNCDPYFAAGLSYGVAYHHAGLNAKQRSTAEILFRLGIVKVVFATGTLALGIHMPCKSVVVFGDSPYLNSIEYHQMSGRAGRRGFDTEGNVIFMGLTKNRQDMLMTERLPKMLGNFPVSVTLIARLLLLVTKVTDNGKSSEEVTNITISRGLALLENSLIFKFKPNLKIQIKYFVDFAAQLLFRQGIYSDIGTPLKLAGIVNHLHYHEPANLVFSYLFRCGALRNLIESTKNTKDAEWLLIVVLSHLFARLKLHKIHLKRKFANSMVILEPLPDIIWKAIKKYNEEVKSLFNEYFISVARHLVDNDDTLPVSGIRITPLFTYEPEEELGTISATIRAACVKRTACSNFVALSGNDDTNLYTGTIISNIKHKICPGIKVVPLLDTDVIYNSYAADFYRHGILSAIRNDNGLKAGAEFTLLKDFCLVLTAIVVCLEEMVPANANDPVYTLFKRLSISFKDKFDNVFYE